MLTVLYDGSCSLCRASVARLHKMDRGGRRIELLDSHDPQASMRFPQVDREEAMRLMQAVDSIGRVYRPALPLVRIGPPCPAGSS